MQKKVLISLIMLIGFVATTYAYSDLDPYPGLLPNTVAATTADIGKIFNPNPQYLGESFIIFFDGDTNEFYNIGENLRQWNIAAMTAMASYLESNPHRKVMIIGTTNGSSAASKDLDRRRIISAKRMASWYGIPESRITKSVNQNTLENLVPISSTAWQNRRVEFRIVE